MKELLKKIDSIKQLVTIKKFENDDFIQYSQSKGGVLKINPVRGHSLILVDEKHRVDVRTILDEINKDKYLNENYSSIHIQKIVLDDIFNVLLGKQTEYIAFRDMFDKTPQDFLVVRSIQGIEVSSIKEIGRYIFIYSQDELEEKCKVIQNSFSKPALSELCTGLQYPVIGVIVSAIDNEKARENAFIEFQKFENVVQFMIGQRWNEFYVRTVSSDILHSEQDICISKESSSGNVGWKGPLEIRYSIKDPYFINDVNQKVWDLFKKSNSSDWEKKLIRSINWAGRGLRNNDINMAFVQMLFSLESLLVGDQKDFLNESITAKLADCIAYILSNDPIKRMKIAKQMKEFYSIRSSIVHYGSENVSLFELNKLFHICQGVLIAFFCNKELENIKSSNNLMDWFNLKKYS